MARMGAWSLWCLATSLAALLAAGGAHAGSTVTVVQLQLPYDIEHQLPLNSTVEYILEFIPPGGSGGERPSRLWVASDGGDSARPVLLTARQRAGAVTWQLPYMSGNLKLLELERTLCPDDTAASDTDASECAGGAAGGGAGGGAEGGAAGARAAFSLHVSSACAAPLRVRVRAALPPVWRLPFAERVPFVATMTAPQVFHYVFSEGQDSVRLVVESDDEVCASISVQNYTCPIAQSLTEISTIGNLRMTVMRSGAVQLSMSMGDGNHLTTGGPSARLTAATHKKKRRQFPLGFYAVALVKRADTACGGAAEPEDDWLWAAAVWGEAARPQPRPQRRKELAFIVQPALSRRQYAVAGAATLALFLGFYAAFGGVVLAQRWPPFARLVRPLAVLAPPAGPVASEEGRRTTEMDSSIATGTPARRRRGSDATFDSSDVSDSDEEEVTASGATTTSVVPGDPVASGAAVGGGGGGGGQLPDDNGHIQQVEQPTQTDGTPAQVAQGAQGAAGPFGLPARLRLAALARRRGRTLRARSDRYLYTLATVAVFYALPVIQFVVAFQIVLNVSGSLDICYYNFLCAHPAGALSDFNHVLSNLGYLLLGALFLLQEYGIPAHYGLLSALGAGMMVVAVLSASYHVCPNSLNFQFDTAFMYVLAVLSMVKIYQSRHPDVNARAHATFGVLAVLIAIVVWGVLGGGPLFWGMFTVLHVFTFLLLSLRIYYVGQFRLEKESLAEAARELRKSLQPMYTTRLVMLLIGNAVNWLFAIYGLVTQTSDFAGHMLQVLLGNALLYMVFYLAMKLVHGERLRWYAWALLAGAAAAWAPALYFFLAGSSDWAAAPALSRHRNHACKVLEFYDSHDLWHLLSAVALYLSFSAMLTWDDGLSAVKRTEIPVF